MAEEKFGGFKLGGSLGGINIVNSDCESLPQDVASALGIVTETLTGANYDFLWYVGNQIVNGTNHIFIAEQTLVTPGKEKKIVKFTLNIPNGSIGGKGAKVASIEDHEDLDEDLQNLFDSTIGKLVGVSYKPIMFVGSQVVKGTNYYFVCESKVIYPGAEPRAVIAIANSFQGVNSVAGIRGINSKRTAIKNGLAQIGCPLGEWP